MKIAVTSRTEQSIFRRVGSGGTPKERIKNQNDGSSQRLLKDFSSVTDLRCLKKHIKTVHENRRNITNRVHFVALAAGELPKSARNDAENHQRLVKDFRDVTPKTIDFRALPEYISSRWQRGNPKT